ncbi:hypothetical protein [Aeromicrobium sp.]|uniref:hypothetical protein n=1 Tax=Aeromicrobium sp. TaxID=1871063 RepID=UPI0028AB7F18|nr:hypothetical protein [Aeromicrobium sp.]
MGKGKKSVKSHVDTVVDQLPDKSELLDLKEQLVDRLPDRNEWMALRDELLQRLPDKSELLDLRDGLVEKLPDPVVDKLPVEKKKRFAGVKKVALVGLVTAGIAGVVAFVKAKMADEPTYTASTYTAPAAPTSTVNPPPPTSTTTPPPAV